MSRKVILLYGSGPNVGAAILKKFAANGWKTAAVVRTMKDEYKNSADLVLQADFADAQEIQKLYSEVETASSSVTGFTKLSSGPKVFIFTGNGFPTSIVPEQPGLGSGKAASAYLIEAAATALKDQSHWYFADERLQNGNPVMTDLSGEAHAEAYYDLAMRKEQGPWNYTFVKGKGYIKCSDVVDHAYTPIAKLFANIGK
ncbi:MAG: hypothetical protein LQ342_006538 [Letrouitia transgressa]|nr:MAG: hypothetical protein LQ342_006538 [Letrouitia transgressa]